MMLDGIAVIHYLLNRGFVSAQEIIDGDPIVNFTRHRNHTFQVHFRERSGLFLKQLSFANTGHFRVERAAQLLGDHGAFKKIKPFLPELLHGDEAACVLIYKLEPGAPPVDWRFALKKNSELPYLLAEAIGCLHNTTKSIIPTNTNWPTSLPPIFSICEVNTPFWTNSPKELKIRSQVYSDSVLTKTIREMRNAWTKRCLIHGDMKLSNVLLAAAVPGEVRSKIKLVDWELARIGDPLWDIAGLVQNLLFALITSKNMAHPQQGIQFWETLRNVREFASTLWSTYLKKTKHSINGSHATLLARFTGLRLLQSSIESMNTCTETHVQALFGLAINITKHPETAFEKLLIKSE